MIFHGSYSFGASGYDRLCGGNEFAILEQGLKLFLIKFNDIGSLLYGKKKWVQVLYFNLILYILHQMFSPLFLQCHNSYRR
jgi:hypothetical protein